MTSPRTVTLQDLEGSPRTVRVALEALAERGVPAAQAMLGQMWLDGTGGVADPARALAWFLKAAAGGDAMAFNMVGRAYENGWGAPADIRVAARWYRQAAERGSDWGMYNHATRLLLGDGCEPDRAAAWIWFQKAAELGHAKSINVVGGFHEDGWETPQDFAKARDCYVRAAEGGDFRGQFNLGRVLASEGDVAGALRLFEQAGQGATPKFVDKMVAFLQAAPIAGYRDLARRLAEARQEREP